MSKYKNILLVEDDVDDQAIFLEILLGISPDVIFKIAPNGKEALNMLLAAKPKPDLIFCDLNMPVMSGFDFLNQKGTNSMYSAIRNIPVIVLTTSALDSQKCYDLGACLYMQKPTSGKLYTSILANLLSRDVQKERKLLRALYANIRG
jgi:CheY-like chemotaxis protein